MRDKAGMLRRVTHQVSTVGLMIVGVNTPTVMRSPSRAVIVAEEAA